MASNNGHVKLEGKHFMNIGFGTAAIGRPQYINIKPNNVRTKFNIDDFKAQGKTVLNSAYALGIRHYDTAPGYGIAETILLEWINENQIDDITISTKWGYTYTADFNPNAKQHEVKEHSLQKLKEQWEYSKKLLPFLNLYQIHSATLETGVLDNQEVLDYLFHIKEEYNVKIGLTTTGKNQKEVIEKANEIRKNNQKLFTLFQVTYNILEQSLKEVMSNTEGAQFIIKEPMANGRILPLAKFEKYHKLYAVLKRMAEKYNVGEDAIALQFAWQSVKPFIVLSGASSKQQIKQNVKTKSFELTSEEITELNNYRETSENYWKERSNLSWQ